MKVKIVRCCDNLMWYREHIGEVFEIFRVEGNPDLPSRYWTREPSGYSNFILPRDCLVIKETNNELHL